MIESVFDTQSNASEDNHLPNAEARSDIAAWLQREVTDDSDEQPRSAPLRYSRRLSDKILIAVHQSCDQGDFWVARSLLDILEIMAQRPLTALRGRERHLEESVVAAHERLWEMQHPTANELLTTVAARTFADDDLWVRSSPDPQILSS